MQLRKILGQLTLKQDMCYSQKDIEELFGILMERTLKMEPLIRLRWVLKFVLRRKKWNTFLWIQTTRRSHMKNTIMLNWTKNIIWRIFCLSVLARKPTCIRFFWKARLASLRCRRLKLFSSFLSRAPTSSSWRNRLCCWSWCLDSPPKISCSKWSFLRRRSSWAIVSLAVSRGTFPLRGAAILNFLCWNLLITSSR